MDYLGLAQDQYFNGDNSAYTIANTIFHLPVFYIYSLHTHKSSHFGHDFSQTLGI
jgi:hypothetical protein